MYAEKKVLFAVPAPAPTPSPQPLPATYTVVSGDTLSGIGTKLGISWQTIASLNNISSPYTIYPGEVLRIGGTPTPPNGSTYTVVSGDTLSAIGSRLGVSWQSIASLNNIPAPYVIYPGEVLRLPGGNVPTPAPTPPFPIKPHEMNNCPCINTGVCHCN